MVFNVWDTTFAITNYTNVGSNCDSIPMLGRAFSCPDPGTMEYGESKINLIGTGFHIPDEVGKYVSFEETFILWFSYICQPVFP